jgi:hypothetical protein
MKLKDAKEQVEREQPHLTGTAKIQAIKALRASTAEPEPQKQKPTKGQDEKTAPKPSSVRDAWGFLVFVIVAMQLIPWIAWGSPTAEPHWFDVLHAALLIGAIAELFSAYKRRRS